MSDDATDRGAWFPAARLGLFLHFGPYALFARGEQVLIREQLDQRGYAEAACGWNPSSCDMRQWAAEAKSAGFRYAVLTTRHHDGFCLWDTKTTDYSTAEQAAGRDLVREFVEAFRAEGLRIGLYYSLADMRLPAFFLGPQGDPAGFAAFREYCHEQVRELLSNYGRVDVFWFDGAWPHDAETWGSVELIHEMRKLQPGMLINNRAGLPSSKTAGHADGGAGPGQTADLGDFGTPEHSFAGDPNRIWESCQVTTWRLWGYAAGERFRTLPQVLDMVGQAASTGGNLLLNVGPEADGAWPESARTLTAGLGRWLSRHGEAVYETQAGGKWFETVHFGHVTRRGDTLYLWLRFYPPGGALALPGLATELRSASLLGDGRTLRCEPYAAGQRIVGLPETSPEPEGFPVIKCTLSGPPQSMEWFRPGLWSGDPQRFLPWARSWGEGPNADGGPWSTTW